MPNPNTPFGLAPIEYLIGAPWSGQCRQFFIPSTDGNAYAIGDPVTIAGSADSAGVASVVLATPGSGLLGCILSGPGMIYGGASFDPNALGTTIIPATKTKGYYVLVSDDPNIVYEVQEIGTGTPLSAAEVGLNANLVAGTNSGYVSGWMLGNTAEAVTATLDVKLLGLKQTVNNVYGAYAKWRVMINNHIYKSGSLGL